MKPIYLCICGWGPYKEKAEIDFSQFMGQGLFLITGATGAGKTTIFDAITYALYGALSGELRDKERSSVRSDFAEADTPTYVELVMEHDKKEYSIRRNPEYYRPKKRGGGKALTKEKENAILRLPDKTVIEGVREVNGRLQELLGVDLQQFKQLSMIAQGEFAKLLTAPPKEKTKIFREIFGTGIYERFTANLSMEAKKCYQRVAEQKAKLDEDLRILAAALKDMEIADKEKEAFFSLLELPAVPFAQAGELLGCMEEQLLAVCHESREAKERAEEQRQEKHSRLSVLEEENKRILHYQEAEKKRAVLEAQGEQYAAERLLYESAVNAGYLEADAVKLQGVQQQLFSCRESMLTLEKEAKEKEEALAESMPIFQRREELTEWLTRRREKAEKTRAREEKEKELLEKRHQLEEGRLLYADMDRRADQCREVLEEEQKRRSYAAIGLAAQLLEEGKPCPVCGSPEHPSPARQEERLCSEEEIEKLRRTYEEARRQAEVQYGLVVSLRDQTERLQQEAALLQQEELFLQKGLEKSKEFYTLLEEEEPEQGMRHLQELCDRVHALTAALAEQKSRLAETAQKEEELRRQKTEQEEAFAQRLLQHGFADRTAYEAAKMDKLKREALEEKIRTYQEAYAAAISLCENLQTHVFSTTLQDVGELQAELEELEKTLQGAETRFRRAEYALTEVKRCKKHLEQKKEAIAGESEQYGLVRELENIAAGNNPRKLVFEQYVLAGYFDEILQAANLRFQRMSEGRYELRRCSEVSDGRTKDNLELEVMDFYTGKARSVRTLSGGESFKASLALALGLSDVIQSRSGGIRIDTLFIDEGFGALDSESLDQACNTLQALTESNHLIGIISHVPELRERISRQLVIEKSGSGSKVTLVKG